MSTVEQFQSQLNQMATDFGVLHGYLTQQTTAIVTDNQEALASINDQISTLSSGLDANAIADLQNVADLLAEDDGLKTLIDANAASVAANTLLAESNSQLADSLRSDMTAAESAITTNASAISALQGLLETLTGSLSALTSRVSTIETDLGNIAIATKASWVAGFESVMGADHGFDFSAA